MNSGRRFLISATTFVTGFLIGIGTGLLLAPRPGRETRRQLRGMADETGEHLGRIAKETKEVFSDASKQGKALVDQTGEHLQKMTQEAKQTATGIAEGGKELVRQG